MRAQNNLPNQKQFSFKLTKIAGIVCSSVLIFSTLNTVQAARGDSFASGIDTVGIEDTEGKKVVLVTQRTVDGYFTRVEEVDGKIKPISDDIKGIEDKLKETDPAVDPTIGGLNEKMGKVATSIQETNSRIDGSNLRALAIETRLGRLETGVDKSREEIAVAKNGLSNAKENIDRAQDRIDQAETSRNNLEVGLSIAKGTAADAKAKASDFDDTNGEIIQELGGEIKNKLDSSLAENKQAVSTANEAATRAEVAKTQASTATSIADQANNIATRARRDLGIVETQLDTAKNGLLEAQGKVKGVDTRVSTAEALTQNNKGSIEKIARDLTDDIEPLLKTVESKADDSIKKANALAISAQENKDATDELDKKVIQLEEDTKTVKSELTKTSKAVAAMDEELTKQKERFDPLDTRVGTLEGNFDSITKGVAKLEIDDKARTAKLMVENADGNTHGLEITGTKTRLTGGTSSSSLTLDDKGATFGHKTTGKPIKVTGIADGSSDFDAVNFRQLDKVSKGVSMSMAMDGIPQAFNGKGSIGLGVARFKGHNALALGASYHDDDYRLTYNIKVAQSGESKEKVNAGSAGIGWEWF